MTDTVIIVAIIILIIIASSYQLLTKDVLSTAFGSAILFIAATVILSSYTPSLEIFLFLTIGAMVVLTLIIFAMRVKAIEKEVTLWRND